MQIKHKTAPPDRAAGKNFFDTLSSFPVISHLYKLYFTSAM